jgi:hypothetical protein|tara:strand:- start:369 stop:1256 length:888 start_codon:yes stop_codon:yes gene_type:complete
MPNWNEVLDEINHEGRFSPLDIIRHKYLKLLNQKTGRNIICYYSGWLQKPEFPSSIDDNDKNGLMTTIHGLDHSLGLDLILHTPGGNVAATESIVHYLRTIFNDEIRVFVPQIAMSAGTMIACASKEIFMGKESNLGPIDPQFGGIPAHGVLDEFNRAVQEVKDDPKSLPIWQTVIQKYHPTFLGECKQAIELSSQLVTCWLKEVMFKDQNDAASKAASIVSTLNNHADTKTHSRHIHFQEAIDMGLNVTMLEEDQGLQDLVLTIHHAYMHTLANTRAVKIIENHKERAMIQSIN